MLQQPTPSSVSPLRRRFLIHVPPDGFHRIRHYGLFASPGRAANVLRLRDAIAADADASQPLRDAGPSGGAGAAVDGVDALTTLDVCPCCGGRMRVVEIFAPGAQPRSFRANPAGIDSS